MHSSLNIIVAPTRSVLPEGSHGGGRDFDDIGPRGSPRASKATQYLQEDKNQQRHDHRNRNEEELRHCHVQPLSDVVTFWLLRSIPQALR